VDGSVDAFKSMVARLHSAGIEVILDVVYNHTAEGNHLGPTLSFKGIENACYYWLLPDKPRYYDDFTGTGNSLNLTHPRVLQLVMDSLRYWVEACHVDGFRFDLATTLGRTQHGFDRHAAFFAAVRQDPVLSRIKLIAEPWDVGLGGYQVGNFPPEWSEWNDSYRSALRRFWRGDGSLLGDLARRMTGSADIFQNHGRAPRASINHVTVHDGFTLADLVSYEHKHNEANGEDNRDGSDNN
jgi:glycogen operon protein